MARPKPSRWDRPKPPHDWRWWVGGTGRTLITIGLLMFAFVAYQLWGTGIQTARAQTQLENEFDQILGDTSGSAPVVVTSVAEVASTTAATEVSVAPTASDVPTTEPAVTTTSVQPTAPAKPVGRGGPVTRIKIPSIGVNKIVVEGVSAKDLRKGPGHFPETPMPGQFGNSAIAGHRTTYGAPFGSIDKVKVDDLVIAITPSGEFHYKVRRIVIVNPDEYSRVIPTSDGSKATLTLVSCHPRMTAQQRIVVIADLIASSAPITEAPPLPPPDDTSTLPGEDDPQNGDSTVTSAAADTSVVDSSTSSPATTDDVTASSTVGSTATDPGGDTPAAGDHVRPAASTDDAFSAGWFSDSAAWPHVALWALALLVWVLACYQLAKRFRRLWLGIAVGIVPFIVMLYFWFENVNRLLPPGL